MENFHNGESYKNRPNLKKYSLSIQEPFLLDQNSHFSYILHRERLLLLRQIPQYTVYPISAHPTNPVGKMYGCYPKTVDKRYMKKGMSLTPFTCARKHLIFEFSDSAEAFV